VVTTDPYQGTYHSKFTVVSWEEADARKTISAIAEVYTRIYIKYLNFPVSQGNVFRFKSLDHYGPGGGINETGVVNDAGTIKWFLNPLGGTITYSTISPSLNVWYCVELYSYISGTAGIARLYVNGSLILEQTGLVNNTYGNVNLIIIGKIYEGDPGTVYIDCVVVADTYIGPEVVGGVLAQII
jgi:hypothetical protein